MNAFHVSITDYKDRHILWLVHNRRHYLNEYEWNVVIRKWAEWVETFQLTGDVHRCYGGEFYSLQHQMSFSNMSDALMVKLAFDSTLFE